MIMLSEETQRIVCDASKQWFEEQIDNWDPKDDPSGRELFYKLFIRGYKIMTPSGLIVTVKMTKESFRNFIGEESYKTLSQELSTNFMSWFYSFLIGSCCGVVFAAHMKPGIARYVISGQASAGITALIQPKMKEALMKKEKEVKPDDEGIQEVSSIRR